MTPDPPDWTRTYARYRIVTGPERRRLEAEPGAFDAIAVELVGELAEVLVDLGWRRADLDDPRGPKVELRISEEHAGWSEDPATAVLAEVRALELLNPDPFARLRR